MEMDLELTPCGLYEVRAQDLDDHIDECGACRSELRYQAADRAYKREQEERD
jgi:hypothetical protein